MNLGYYFFLTCLLIFSGLFFAYDLYIDKIKELKSNRLLYQSSVYLNASIDNAGGLLEDGVNKAKIAYLLNPNNANALETYLDLLFRTDPVRSLFEWSFSPLIEKGVETKGALLEKCLNTLQTNDLNSEERQLTASVALRMGNQLENSTKWNLIPANSLLICELLAEVGQTEDARARLKRILEKNPDYPDAIFLATRLIVHLENDEEVIAISRALAKLSTRRNEIGIEAIRHMTLLNILAPLSKKALLRCNALLRSNPTSKPIDFLRIYALIHSQSSKTEEQNLVIEECSQLFDLNDREQLLVFSNWLAKLEAIEHLAFFLPASKAKVDEDLFKLRMAALAKLGDIERISQEINDAPIIPLIWRLVVETRAFSLGGKHEDARKTLNRLMPLIEEDPRKVRAVCIYLESVNDITNLSHILEKIIENPLHQKFALVKLLEHRSASTDLEDLLSWLSKLQVMRKQDHKLENAYLYFRLLDNKLSPSSPQIMQLLEEAKKQNRLFQNKHTQISLALAYLRNDDPSNALVALGKLQDWRHWANERPAWALITSYVYDQNHDSEKALLLRKGLDLNKMDQAEKQSLMILFPSVFQGAED